MIDKEAFEDLQYWIINDRKKSIRIFKLIKEILKTPFSGTGKPEALKYDFAEYYSRRIDQEHRLIYKVDGNKVIIISCRYHY